MNADDQDNEDAGKGKVNSKANSDGKYEGGEAKAKVNSDSECEGGKSKAKDQEDDPDSSINEDMAKDNDGGNPEADVEGFSDYLVIGDLTNQLSGVGANHMAEYRDDCMAEHGAEHMVSSGANNLS
ncbi:hypothetical protein CVT25_012650 [Psilocybe cyanescens]|uniref:Uncharacterized protein n=1 Tax=Psilocybe cyanescens TaxID=93625 RepID=A0A409X4B1_PSICY|nr:hypothetical protein CVT25_012650 [Psilocybe cyanescens]